MSDYGKHAKCANNVKVYEAHQHIDIHSVRKLIQTECRDRTLLWTAALNHYGHNVFLQINTLDVSPL